jgi:hypothetical protein
MLPQNLLCQIWQPLNAKLKSFLCASLIFCERRAKIDRQLKEKRKAAAKKGATWRELIEQRKKELNE